MFDILSADNDKISGPEILFLEIYTKEILMLKIMNTTAPSSMFCHEEK